VRVSKDAYLRLIENRPYKFDAEEVNYREAEGDESCGDCQHFYTRKVDGYNVCEVFRDVTKKGENPIDPEKVCDFFTEDGEEFPLLGD
jgi:hypothetical protein